MKQHDAYVIDIESLDTAVNCAITSVCIMPVGTSADSPAWALANAVVFGLQHVTGTTISESTIDFHSKHDPTGDNARNIVRTMAAPDLHITDLPDLRFGKKQPKLWGNGKDFDMIRLEQSIKLAGGDPADYWHYRQWLDLPTIMTTCPAAEIFKHYVRKRGSKYLHHPMFDCLLERQLLLMVNIKAIPMTEAMMENAILELEGAFEEHLAQCPTYKEAVSGLSTLDFVQSGQWEQLKIMMADHQEAQDLGLEKNFTLTIQWVNGATVHTLRNEQDAIDLLGKYTAGYNYSAVGGQAAQATVGRMIHPALVQYVVPNMVDTCLPKKGHEYMAYVHWLGDDVTVHGFNTQNERAWFMEVWGLQCEEDKELCRVLHITKGETMPEAFRPNRHSVEECQRNGD